MKTKILSLVLFLLTTLGATAKMKLSIRYLDDKTFKTWSRELDETKDQRFYFRYIDGYRGKEYTTNVEWLVSSKTLSVSNPNFSSLEITSDSSDELNLEFPRSNAYFEGYVGYITVNKPGTLKISSEKKITALEFLKSNSRLILKDYQGRTCTIGHITGATDKSTSINFDGEELIIEEAENCSGIKSITCTSGVNIVTPHGGYLEGGVFKGISGNKYTGKVEFNNKAKSYGFSIAGTKVTEANYDLLDNPSRYFPGVAANSIKYDPATKTLDMDRATIDGNIVNESNPGLRIRVSNDCKAKEVWAECNTTLISINPRSNLHRLNVDGINIAGRATLQNYVYLSTNFIHGRQASTDVKNIARLCIKNDASGLCGKIKFEGGCDSGIMYDVRLVNIVDVDSELNIDTWHYLDGHWYEWWDNLFYGKQTTQKRWGRYGIFDKKTDDFATYGSVTLDGYQSVYPLKVGGIQVTDANRRFIVSPDIQYPSNEESCATISYDPSENTLYINGANFTASGDIPAIEYTGNDKLRIKVGRNDLLAEEACEPTLRPKINSKRMPVTITCKDQAPALVSNNNVSIMWGTMTVNSENSSSMKCGAFNVAGTMSFSAQTNVTVPVVSAKELKASTEANVNITKGLTGSNTSFGENTYKATLTNCDVQASANAYYEPDNHFIYATGPVQISPIGAATKYPFWVFGRQVTSLNHNYICGSYLKSGSLKFNPSTNIFEMRDAQVDYTQEGGEPFIKTKDRALNLMLYGKNAVNCSAEAIVADGDNLSIMGGDCALTLTPATQLSKSASIHLANGATMSVYASKPSFTFHRITHDGSGTVEVNCPMTLTGNGSTPTIAANKIELDEEVELLNTLDRPQTLSDGTVIDGRTKRATTGTVEFVPKGTSPIYPTAIEIEDSAITLTQRGASDRIVAKVFPEDATDPTLTWSCSDYNVVLLGTNGYVRAVKNGTATITATTKNGVKATATVTVAIPDPVNIDINVTDYWFKDPSNTSFLIDAIVEDEDADQTIEWSSSDKNIVNVVPFGKTCRVERVADEGTAIVKAKTVNNLTVECAVKIHFPIPAQTINLSENQVRFLEVGETKEISINVGPDDVEAEYLGYYLDFRGGDEEVATVGIYGNTLRVTAKKEGTMGVAVWATCDGAPVTYDYLNITVKPTVLAQSLTIMNPTGMEPKFYAYGQRMQLTAVLTPENVDNKEVTWTSSAPSVATVDENGVVTSVSEGYATIKATTTDGSNLTAEYQVQVLNPADWAIVPANGVTLSRKEMILFPGQTYEMTAELLSEYANTYVDWEVEQISGDGGQVEVTPGNWSEGYEAEPAQSRYADIQAYVPNKAEATFPIVARIVVKARDYEGEDQPTDTCFVTILDDIYFTEANAEGIDIKYHVISGDPEFPECELYAATVMKHDENGYYETVEPAIDGELTGKLIVPSVANGYWVTTIGKNAFSKSKIEEVELPEGLTTVAAGAFEPRIGFDNLKAVTLPSTLKYLGDGAFQGQTNLKQVTIKNTVVPQSINDMGNVSDMLNGCFAGIASDAVLNVPYDCIDTYFYPGSDWNNWFATIDDGSYLTAETDEKLTMSFHISSMGEMTAEVKGKPISEMENELAVDANATEVTIPMRVEGYKVTSISEYAFVNHGNNDVRSKMEKVFIPETIEKIDGNAFMECKELKEVTINRETPPAVNGAFECMDPMQAQQRTLFVPNGCKEAYNAYPWTTWFGIIEELPSPDYLPDTDISKIANVIYAASMKANAGETAMLSIRMKNSAPIHAFQFRLTLPEGAELVKMGKNKYMASINQERMPADAEPLLSFAKQADGTIMFLGGILSEGSYAAGDGEVINMPLNISEGMEDGEYPIVLQQIKLTEADVANYYETSVVKSTLTIGEGGEIHYVLGDATGDGVVDVSDYTIVANQILTDSTTTEPASTRQSVKGFNAAAADINKDDQVDVSDYTGVANIILFGGSNGAKSAHLPNGKMRANEENVTSENLIYVKDFSLGDGNIGEMELPICMKSEVPIRSFQFDLYLPDGMEAVKTSKGKFTTTWNADRLPADDEHTLSLAQQSDGAIRVLCGSLYDETFEGEDGVLFKLKVNVSGMADGSYIIALKDIKLSETDITKFYKTTLFEAVMNIDTDTSIDAVSADDLKGAVVFDLQGRRVQSVEKGIYIVNGRKVVIK